MGVVLVAGLLKATRARTGVSPSRWHEPCLHHVYPFQSV